MIFVSVKLFGGTFLFINLSHSQFCRLTVVCLARGVTIVLSLALPLWGADFHSQNSLHFLLKVESGASIRYVDGFIYI